jgi:Major Facilitator Superfamily
VSRPRVHYAWVVGGVTFLALLASAGIGATRAVLVLPLEREFGWDRATISLALSVNLLLFGLCGPFAGALMLRVSVGRVMLTALTTLAMAVTLSIFMQSAWQLVALWGVLIGLGSGAMALVLGATVATRWFVQRRGLVTGLFAASTATGQLLFLPLQATVVEVAGWRLALAIVAGEGPACERSFSGSPVAGRGAGRSGRIRGLGDRGFGSISGGRRLGLADDGVDDPVVPGLCGAHPGVAVDVDRGSAPHSAAGRSGRVIPRARRRSRSATGSRVCLEAARTRTFEQAVPLGITAGDKQATALRAVGVDLLRSGTADQVPRQGSSGTRGIEMALGPHHHAPAEPADGFRGRHDTQPRASIRRLRV